MAQVDKPSRLSESTNKLRQTLQTRNLYTEFKQYPPEPDQVEKIVNSISAVVETIQPFRSVNLKNSAFGRLVNLPNTPLTNIGLIMLGKQFGLNFSSNLAQQTYPSFKPLNIFKRGDNIFEKNVNLTITNKQQVSGRTNIQSYLQRFLSFTKAENPLPVNISNSELMERTGKGQLEYLFGDGKTNGGINRNIYKPGDTEYYRVASINNLNINDRNNIVNLGDKIWFNFSDRKFNPYINFSINNQSQENANKAMINSYNLAVFGSNNTFENQEYIPEQSKIDTYLGQTENRIGGDFINTNISSLSNIHLDNNDGLGLNQKISDQIVWGRTGVGEKANERLKTLRGLEENNEFYNIEKNDNVSLDFNGKTGLLAYTRNLLNATDGNLIDQTRKVFEDGKGKLQGFNGSGVWNSNNSTYANKNGFNNKRGIRQHSPLDQYDRFAKAIRFNGNIAYGGNPDSVLYNSVLPRIHPTYNDENNKINNGNLTLSLENLAVKVVGDDKQAFVDDDFGTEIPIDEKGLFGGRMMWFPPYGLELNETANAKYDETVFVGRNEPIYTYQYSERSANLSFLLLIDHPSNVKNYISGSNKDIAEFFTFGGEEYNIELIRKLKKYEGELTDKIREISDEKRDSTPDVKIPESIRVSFPNDSPVVDNVTNVFNKMYNEYYYEIDEQIISTDGNSSGLNSDIYLFSGFTLSGNVNEKYSGSYLPYIDQYNVPYIQGERKLDDTLYNLFSKPENRKFFKLNIVGGASKLYTPTIPTDIEDEEEYNEDLGRNRAEALKYFIESRIKVIFGESALKDIIIEFGENNGSTGSQKAKIENATISAISKLDTKLERYATLEFAETEAVGEVKKNDLTAEQEEAINTLKKEIARLNRELSAFNKNLYVERKSSDLSDQDDGILHSFQAIIDGKFYPVFNSQTPEDFHKRLTFLQQCTRQGAAIKQEVVKDGNSIERAKNSVFGRQPICVLRIGDFFHTKVIINTITIDYVDATWDLNPEGFGMQPMIAKVNIQMKVIGGQSLKGPVDTLQNAVSYNYYANSTYSDKGIYILPSYIASLQDSYNKGIDVTDDRYGNISERFESKKSANLEKISSIINSEKEDSN